MESTDGARCGARTTGGPDCLNAPDPSSGLTLCEDHLLAAYEWVSRNVGVSDLLPAPCLACGSQHGIRYPSGWLCAICEWRFGDVPDPELTQPRLDVVYYLRYRQTVKIGTTANPRARLAQLRYDEVLAFERGNRRREHQRHEQFAAHRIAGSEWFTLHPALESHIHELRAASDDPWDDHRLWVSQAVARAR